MKIKNIFLFNLVLFCSISACHIQLVFAVDDFEDVPVVSMQPAYGISSDLLRWDGPISIALNPTNAIDVPMLKWLENAANIWERVSGIKFNEITTNNNVIDDRTSSCYSNSDKLVSAVWNEDAQNVYLDEVIHAVKG